LRIFGLPVPENPWPGKAAYNANPRMKTAMPAAGRVAHPGILHCRAAVF